MSIDKARINAALAQELSLTGTLALLGFTHLPSEKHQWVKDILLDGRVVGSFCADGCWEWLHAGCPVENVSAGPEKCRFAPGQIELALEVA